MFILAARRRLLGHWLPGLALALAGCAASYALWLQQTASMQSIAQARFAQETRLFADALQRRMESHAELLQGMRGLTQDEGQQPDHQEVDVKSTSKPCHKALF